ncbi:MAG: hypothetical protein N3A62_02885 [Thermodesulfovibrionales bacterium]|nr:hypothetical protein [Thermodesulfovibrionales bacterium]
MAQLLIRDLQTETVNLLKEKAKQHNRSLQREVKAILEEAAIKPSVFEIRTIAEKWRKRLNATGKTFSDSAKLLREDRKR